LHKTTLAWIASALFTLATGIPPVSAQDMYRPQAVFSQEDLDQLLAPVALYPDSLLAQVLMAATYPLQVVQAARFIESRPGLSGDALARAVAPMPWDPSVKSLVQFPSVLTMMNERLDWMQRLGDAFLAQQAGVMDTVQNLRIRAQVAGNLYSNEQQRVVLQEQVILIEPVNPQRIYIPYYNPVVVYGNWWWPQRPPQYWTPPPRYRPPNYSAAPPQGIVFSVGIGVPRAVYDSARPDWHQHQVLVNNVQINHSQVTNKVIINQQPQVWQHKPGNPPEQRRADSGNDRNARNVANGLRPNAAPVGANVPEQAMPATHQSRPVPEHRPEPAATPRPQTVPASVPQKVERAERPEHHDRNEHPVRIERPSQPLAQRPATETHASAAPHQEQHKDTPRPETKPKPDDHPHHPDDK
jgi:hypothetical protein